MDIPGEKLVIKMWDTLVEKGIGSILQPWHEKRLGYARNEIRQKEILMLAQAEKIAEDIRRGDVKLLQDGTLVKSLPDKSINNESDFNVDEVISCIEASNRSDDLRNQVNIGKSIIFAEQELANDPQEPPDRNIDDDWLYRWKDSASKVSADELQQLWGKLLAGELKSPGKYSLRTLEFLKNISQNEARLIEKLAQFSIAGCVARDEADILKKNDISFGSLIYLQELGVITGVEAIGMTVEYTSDINSAFQKVMISNSKALLITHEDANRKLTLSCYGLSSIGKEVLTLGSFNPNEEYLISLGRKFVNGGYKVELGDWVQIDENHGRLLNTINIEKENA